MRLRAARLTCCRAQVDARGALAARVLSRFGASLGELERAGVARQPVDVLRLLDQGLARPADLFAAEAHACADRGSREAHAYDDAEEVRITHVVEGDEPAWRARARAAAQALSNEATLAPSPVRRLALDAVDAVLRHAAEPDAKARGRHSVSVAALARRVRSGVTTTAGAAGSAAPASSADAACGRAVSAVVRVLESAGWYVLDDADARLLLLVDARSEAALMQRMRDVRVLLRGLAAVASTATEATDADDTVAAWEALAASDAVKVEAQASLLAPALGGKAAEADAAHDAGVGGLAYDDELWERYSSRAAPLPGGDRGGYSQAAYSQRVESLPLEEDDVEVLPTPPPPAPPMAQCRVVLSLPDGGSARMVLPPTATLLDVYAAVATHLAAPRAAAAASGSTLLAQHDWHDTSHVDLAAYRLLRPQPAPARVFRVDELAALSLADAGAYPSARLVVERAGGGGLCQAAPNAVFSPCTVLRVTDANGMPSPILHLHNLGGDGGVSLFAKLRSLLPAGWATPNAHPGLMGMPASFPKSMMLHNAMWAGGAAAGDALGLAHRSTIPMQDYADAALRTAASALRAKHGDTVAGRAAAAHVSVRRPFMQASALLYSSGRALHDHVDHVGNYLVLLSLGCTVNFLVDGRVIVFA